jgi:hypothetical protein
MDAPVMTGDAAPCQAPATLTFTSTAVTPLTGQVCTETILNNFLEACFGVSGSQQACGAFHATDAGDTCAQCVLSYYAGIIGMTIVAPPAPPVSAWGPLVGIGEGQTGILFTNIGSCIKIADPSAAGQACATAFTNNFECQYQACAQNCPVSMAQGAALETCMMAAEEGACSTQSMAFATACMAYGADGSTSPGAFCFDTGFPGEVGVSPQQAENFLQLVLQQCGEPDGG